MERQLPKNVRQIGNVCDEPKIYVEDYVDTFLGQLQEKAMEKPVAAALTGEITKCEDKVVVYISGAIRAEDVEVEGTNLKISEEIWEKIEKEQKEYFKDQKLIGWCLLETGHPMSMNRGAQELHRKMYDQENTIFIWKDASSSDEMYFAYKYNELMQIGGHYIYYEKNPQMQNYMINTRRQNGVTPSEMVEDRATKDFRSVVRERMDAKSDRQNSRLIYITSALLVVVVLVIGVSTMNNYDKMEAVQSSLESLSQSVNSPESQTETVTEDEGDDEEEGAAAKAQVETGETESVQEASGDTASDSSGEGDTDDTGAVMTADPSEIDLDEDDYYVVQKGDTLDTISMKVYGDAAHVDAICRMNGLSDGNLIYIGQKLLLP